LGSGEKGASCSNAVENEEKSKRIKTKLQGDDRVNGKNKKRLLKIVSEIEGGEAVTADVFKQVKEVDDEINLEDPRDYMVEPLRDEIFSGEPYDGASTWWWFLWISAIRNLCHRKRSIHTYAS